MSSPRTLLCLFGLSISVFAADWNQWRGPLRIGVAPDSPPLIDVIPDEGLKPVWMATSIPGSGGWSSPVVAEGRVFLFSHQRIPLKAAPKLKYARLSEEDRKRMTDAEVKEYYRKRADELYRVRSTAYRYQEDLFCFNAADGTAVWQTTLIGSFGDRQQSSTPFVIDGRVYVLGSGFNLRCFDAARGKQLWVTPIQQDEDKVGSQSSSFIVVDGIAVVLVRTGPVGVDAKTGEVRWQIKSEKPADSHSSPAVWRHAGKSYIVANVGRDTICLNSHTGATLWRAASSAGRSTPIVIGDLLVTASNSRKSGIRAFDLSLDGANAKWAYDGVNDKGGTPVVFNNLLFAHGGKRVVCLDVKTGEEKWRKMITVEGQYSSPIAADGKVYYAYQDLFVYRATGEKFDMLAELRFDRDSVAGTANVFQKKYGIDKLDQSTADGRKQALRIMQQNVGRYGVYRCTTPAIVDGRIYLRTRNGITCYDLRAKTKVAVR